MSMNPYLLVVYGFQLGPDEVTDEQWGNLLPKGTDPEDWWAVLDEPDAPCLGFLHRASGEGVDGDPLFLGTTIVDLYMSGASIDSGIERLDPQKSEQEIRAFADKHGLDLGDMEPEIFLIKSWG